MSMKVKGYVVETGDDHYQAGHTLAENEAKALSGLRNENIGHSVRARMGEDFPSAADVPEDQLAERTAQVQAAFDEAAQGYQFGQRTGGGGRAAMDPVTAMARQMAREAINAQAKEQGLELTKEQRTALVNLHESKFRKAAEKFVRDTADTGNKLSLNLPG